MFSRRVMIKPHLSQEDKQNIKEVLIVWGAALLLIIIFLAQFDAFKWGLR